MADYKSKHTGATIDEAIDRVLNNAPQDGFSPIVTIDTITDGHRVNIRDKNGTKSFDVMDGEAGQDGKTPVKGVDYFDGEDGQDGADGVSPTVTASKSGKVTTVTIKDVSGTKTFTINDGEDGSPGSAGEDGVGVANIYQKTTSLDDGGENVLVIETSDGKIVNFKVRNGRSGKDGTTPVKGVDYFDGAPGVPGDDGYTPIKGVDYYTDADKAEIEAYIAQELAKRGQVEPEYANSTDECTDTGKLYVLPDGYIYAYMPSTGPSYTNLAGNVQFDKRLSSSGKISSTAMAGAAVTDFIPIKKGDVLRIKGLDIKSDLSSSAYPYFCFYTGASESNITTTSPVYVVPSQHGEYAFPGYSNTPSGGVCTWTAFVKGLNGSSPVQHDAAASLTHVRISGKYLSGQDIIVTVNEEITEGGSSGYAWQSTGHAFIPADYEDRIVALERHTNAIPESRIIAIEDALNAPTEAAYSGNILFGKKWVACGDSFTAGGYNASDGFDQSVYIYQDGKYAGLCKVYPYIIGLRNGMNIVNLASGGQTMGQSSNSFMSLYQSIPDDADYITIMLGINDKLQNIPVGALEDSTNTTFCGCYNIAMEHILTNHPYAHVGIMASHGTNAEIMTATRGIAERWGVPYLDYGSPQVPLMNRYTGRNVCAKAQQIREKNFCVISDGVTPTNSHPNTAAHEFESTFIEAWLRTL